MNKNSDWMSRLTVRGLVVLITVLACWLGAVAAEQSPFTKKDKAFYLSEQDLNFVRPGLQFKILEAKIEENGTIWYRFTLTDPKGLPLDRLGIFTPGEISVRSVAAFIPRGQVQDQTLYRAYTVRTQTSPITNVSSPQATSDSGGRFEQVADGEYIYTFGVKAPLDFDRGATHRIAAWTARDLTEFDLGESDSSDSYTWVPDGSPVTARDIVSDQACNACHGSLGLHDERRTVAVCITCHQPQSTDPDTGNTVDFTVMIHKIHMGAGLPSVQAGTPYQIIGFRQSVHDYSHVEFPADVRNCQVCHQAPHHAMQTESAVTAVRLTSGVHRQRAALQPAPEQATQANNYLTKPSARACGACHDNVNFASGVNHAGGPQPNDSQCARCHIPEGEMEFDISIKGAHTIPRFSKDLPGTNFEIISVSDTGPGEKPTVTFSITNDAGNPVMPADMLRLALVIGGSTNADISAYWSENATIASGSGSRFFYTFLQALPEDAQGTWMVGIEGYQSVTLQGGTTNEVTVRDAGENKVFYFPVTDTTAVPRRAVVAQEKCDACHFDLDLHGSNRNDVKHCVLCHNPNLDDSEYRAAEDMPPEGVNFKDMIHKIHTGEELQIPYTVIGFRGSVNDFTEVLFPADRRDCTVCHIDGTQQLPLIAGALPSVNPRGFIDPTPPVTAACLSCHSSMSAAAHADLNTSPTLGESCNVCHGEGADFSIDRVHAE